MTIRAPFPRWPTQADRHEFVALAPGHYSCSPYSLLELWLVAVGAEQQWTIHPASIVEQAAAGKQGGEIMGKGDPCNSI